MDASLSGKLETVERNLRGHIEDVDAHLSGKLDTLSLKVGVLHEDVKADFRFSLEARQGLREEMIAGFTNQELAFKNALAPIQDALRRANELRDRESAR